jgi:hypothetical protein
MAAATSNHSGISAKPVAMTNLLTRRDEPRDSRKGPDRIEIEFDGKRIPDRAVSLSRGQRPRALTDPSRILIASDCCTLQKCSA